MGQMRAVDRAVRRELDRLTGEIMRRWDEDGDVCCTLNARREQLLDAHGGRRFVRLVRSRFVRSA